MRTIPSIRIYVDADDLFSTADPTNVDFRRRHAGDQVGLCRAADRSPYADMRPLEEAYLPTRSTRWLSCRGDGLEERGDAGLTQPYCSFC